MTPQQLRASLLQQALSGRLVPQRPEDGTADTLYEEIQQEKARLIAEKKIKKEKPLPPIAEEDIPFDIPDTWKWVRLESVCSMKITDGTHQTPKYADKENGVAFISAKDITTQKICWDNIKYIIPSLHEELYKRIAPQKDDVLLAKNGTTGVAALVEDDRVFDIYVTLAVLRPEKRLVLPKYLWQVVNSPICKAQFDSHLKGIGVPNLHLTEIRKVIIPLPPLAEQERIVAKLEELLPLVDQYGDAAARLADYEARFPDDLRKSLLQEAITGRLVPQRPEDGTADALYEEIQQEKARLIAEKKIKKGKPLPPITEEEKPFDIPDTWKWIHLGDCGSWASGATPSRTNEDFYNGGTIPWLKTGDLNDGVITQLPEYITELALEKTSVRLNPIGSVLMAMYGATIGRLGILSIAATTNQACCACIPYTGINNKYLFYFLLAWRPRFIKQGAGGAQPNISKEKIVNTPFPLPPLAEQKRIVAKLEELLPLAERIRSAR